MDFIPKVNNIEEEVEEVEEETIESEEEFESYEEEVKSQTFIPVSQQKEIQEDIFIEDEKPKTNAETFKNNRAQYYIALSDRFYQTYKCVVNGEYVDPDKMISLDSEGIKDILALRSQLCRIPRKKGGNGLQQIMSKAEMKKEGIDSPNEADSVMMCLYSPYVEEEWANIEYESIGIV